MSWRRPYGTSSFDCETLFPTLKRGANKRCAYGAGDNTDLDTYRNHRDCLGKCTA